MALGSQEEQIKLHKHSNPRADICRKCKLLPKGKKPRDVCSATTISVIPSVKSHSIPSNMPADDGTACNSGGVPIALDLVAARLVETFEVPVHRLDS